MRAGIFKLSTLGIQQGLDQTLSRENLLLCLALDVHVLRHGSLLVTLPLVTDIAAADEDFAACCFLQSFVIDTTGTNDDTHERRLWKLLNGDDDLFEELSWLPVHRWQIAIHVFDHEPNQTVVFCSHCFPDADIAGVEAIPSFVVHRRRRWRPYIRVHIFKLVSLDLSVEVLQTLFTQKLIDLLLREAHWEVDVGQWLIRLVIWHTPTLSLFQNLALRPP
mmetsp:Transcript_57915/g.103614  ORF Transcript_57915/g.103614 Transcript_57915/m.103614 type:complete len:220 (+) Transcript_57915:372-1031(+)